MTVEPMQKSVGTVQIPVGMVQIPWKRCKNRETVAVIASLL
ncbi:hypothetical protein [Bacillus sp. 165]|nr:hypothetical protein [Bacillus sp. 165]